MLLPWVQWTLVLLNLSFCRTDNSFLSLVSHLLILALDKTRSLVQVAYIPHQLDFIFRLNLEFLSLGRANPFTLFGVSGFVHAILHHLLFNTPCKPPHSPLFFWIPFCWDDETLPCSTLPSGTWESHVLPPVSYWLPHTTSALTPAPQSASRTSIAPSMKCQPALSFHTWICAP